MTTPKPDSHAQFDIFRYQGQIRFHEADPAGWMFFGRAFELAHDCLEDFLVFAGFEWAEWFKNSNFAMPIRKADADYRRPLAVGTKYEIECRVLNVGTSSVNFEFTFKSGLDICLVLNSTHVLMDLKTQKSVPWPENFRLKLTAKGPTA